MRKRAEVEADFEKKSSEWLILEVLLDIRDLAHEVSNKIRKNFDE